MDLTSGSIKAIYQDLKNSPLVIDPVVQVLNIKKLNSISGNSNGDGPDRYRITLSDGLQFLHAMLGVQLNSLIQSEKIKINSLIVLKKFACSLVKERRVVIILNMDINNIRDYSSKIGSPTPVENNSGENNQKSTENALSNPISDRKTYNPLSGGSSINYNTTYEQSSYKPKEYVSNRQLGDKQNNTDHIQVKEPTLTYNPINSISPYQNKWNIIARITAKSDIRTWSNQKGDGKLFSINLLDKSGEIRATIFGDLVELFYPMFEIGKIYSISKGQVKIANRKFSNVDNDYEIVLEKDSIVNQLGEDSLSLKNIVPSIEYSFVPIKCIVDLPKDQNVDVIGIVKEIYDISQITIRSTQKQLNKRDILLVDMSLHSTKVTFWGKQAEDIRDILYKDSSEEEAVVLSIRSVKVTEFNGKSLTVSANSSLIVNPDIKEAYELRGWYDTIGMSLEFDCISASGSGLGTEIGARNEIKYESTLQSRKLVSQIRGSENGERSEFFYTLATITLIKSDGGVFYPSCPGISDQQSSGKCQKKVVEVGPNLYKCEKCQTISTQPVYRYIVSLMLSDFSGQTRATAFNDTGEIILGMTAQELSDEVDEVRQSKIIKNACFQTYLFKLRTRDEVYQGELIQKTMIQSVSRPNYVSESKMVLDFLQGVI